VSDLLGVRYPISQERMGWIARAQLASAVSEAGGLGIIETSSGELDAVRDEIRKMRDLTDKPFGVNIAQAFVRDPAIVEFVIDQGVSFVTTSAGDPTKHTAQLKEAGLTVFHGVPTLAGARPAAAGGGDGQGAAGGFVDGPTMAAAFALGAEGVQMGTRMVSAAESPVHDNWKQMIVDAAETDTVFLNQHASPALRALRTEYSSALEFDHERNAMASFGDVSGVYFRGDLSAGIALSGQVAGRIDDIRPVADLIGECARDCLATIEQLHARYVVADVDVSSVG
jgi:enoyl-[acyl-carrier protein] reductase II